jgi:alkanesulfonate monooxygenase SsuD/methylene tetrahydromethanopterin reductase-like flavin-dependent oxidoreductase (luciferase family)
LLLGKNQNAGDVMRKPTFRADHVGSLLRPQELKDARAQRERGVLSEEQLRAVEDECISDVLGRQARAGYYVVAAAKYLDRVVEEYGDEDYLDNFVRIANPSVNNLPPAERAAMRKNLKRVVGGEQLLGSADDIAAAIAQLSDSGIDGILHNWVNPCEGIKHFNAEVLPLLERANLRMPASEGTRATAL